ncbi:MAG: hypothetical protein R3C10_23960 [Pirellulales bacterium]
MTCLNQASVVLAALGASFDGSVVVGYSLTPSGEDSQAFIWDAANGIVDLGRLPGKTHSVALDVSAGGGTVTGTSYTPDSGSEAFLWTESGGMVGLGALAGHEASSALGISADGVVVVGASIDTDMAITEAFRWTSVDGMQGLGTLTGSSDGSDAVAVSADGSTIVGNSSSTNGYQAFRWTEAGGMVGLGDLPGGQYSSRAAAVSGDGSIVIGYGTTSNPNSVEEAFIWDETNGMRRVADALADLGVDLTGWTLRYAKGISDDGNVIGGWEVNPDGQEQAWIANLAPTPATPTATTSSTARTTSSGPPTSTTTRPTIHSVHPQTATSTTTGSSTVSITLSGRRTSTANRPPACRSRRVPQLLVVAICLCGARF